MEKPSSPTPSSGATGPGVPEPAAPGAGIARSKSGAARQAGGRHPLVSDALMLTGDLMAPRPLVYYADLVASAGVAWVALFAAAEARGVASGLLLVASVLAFYRAASFIHELTHLRPGAVPGFVATWNALVGIPLLLPSMLYVGVHPLHHARARYGTAADPEYLPIGRWPSWKIAVWILHAALLPIALLLRFAVLAPLSALHPGLREIVWERASALTINPAFRRARPRSPQRRAFVLQEAACAAWAIALVALTATELLSIRLVLLAVVVAGAVGVLNQLRTAVAHRFRNEEPELSFEEQFLDSVNVPGSRLWTPLWAPVGLRFHALHHLLPGLPYHALGEAHRRLLAAREDAEVYARSCEASLGSALAKLLGRPSAGAEARAAAGDPGP